MTPTDLLGAKKISPAITNNSRLRLTAARSRRPGRSVSAWLGSSGTAGLRMCACGWVLRPCLHALQPAVSPCSRANSRKLLAAAPALRWKGWESPSPAPRYCLARCRVASSLRADAEPCTLRGFSGASFSIRWRCETFWQFALSILQGLGRRRHFCRDPQSRARVIPRARGEPSGCTSAPAGGLPPRKSGPGRTAPTAPVTG